MLKCICYRTVNAPIEFEEIIAVLEDFESELIVELLDDNATYKAYTKLVEKFEELEIPIVEK